MTGPWSLHGDGVPVKNYAEHMTQFIGFGWKPRCPNCGATVAHEDASKGKAGIYPCGACGAVHERDSAGVLVLDDSEGQTVQPFST